MTRPYLHLSQGNHKIGPCLNLSLPPDKTCIGRACSPDCYARKGQCNTRECKTAWEDNLHLWQDSPGLFEGQLYQKLSRAKITRFRWHVGGDIPDKKYLWLMCYVAEDFPKISFTCYTKSWYDRPEIRNYLDFPTPHNLKIWLSVWEKHGYRGPAQLPPGLHGRFVTVEKDEKPPLYAFTCPGYCPTCLECWHASRGFMIWTFKH